MIKLVNANKYYLKGKTNQVHALKDANLTIDDGDLIAVTGPSGSGKSTLLHILAGIDSLSSGDYFFNEKNMNKATDTQKALIRNKSIGIVLQDFGLLGDQTAAENVKLPMKIAGIKKKEANKKAFDALSKVKMEKLAHKNINLMSGGQKQRVAIARALAMDAKIIFADEPTGALDSASTAELLALIKELNSKGITFLIVTHNNDVAAECGRRINIVDGVLAES